MEKLKTNELSLGLNQTLRNDLVDNFEKIQKGVDGQSDSLNKQILDMLGDVPLQDQNEVTQARIDANGKSYDTLKGREDATQATAETALSEERDTLVEVQDARTNSNSKTYSTLKARMDSQENDLNNSINNKLSQISSVPEAFANLAALQKKYPTGKTGIFVTADTGHKYIWVNGSWTDAGVYQSAGYSAGLKSLVGFAYPAVTGGIPIITKDSNITITIPDKIFAMVLSSDTNTDQKLLTINSPGDVILAPGEFLYVDISNLIISHGNYDALSALNNDYLIIGYNSYGSLTGAWASYQTEQITRINTSLSSWAYPITSETVSISNISDSILSVKLPSAVMMATDYQRLQSVKFTSLVSKLTLSNGNATITLNNNNLLVLDVDKQTVDSYDTASLAQLSDHYILLAVNHYGNLKGPWSIYQPSDKLVNDNNYLPKYYFDNNYIDDKIKSIRQNSKVTTGTNFAYFTDSHWGDNGGQQGKLLNYVTQNTSVETIIFGGDIPRAYGTQADLETDGQTYLTLSRSLKHPVYGMHGNHDMTIKTNDSTDSGYTAPQIDQYDILNRGNELIQHGVQSKNYYYLDNPIQKVRYIIIDDWEGLDTSTYWGVKAGVTQQQLDWMLTTALNADGYTFIVLTHAPSDSKLTSFIASNDVVQQLLVAINNKRQFNYDENGIRGSADFTATTNHIAMHLCGHNHRDESNVEDNVLSVSTMCDALYNNDPKYTTVRSTRTINEQCIDVISVDTTARTIKMVRIGAGNDRSFDY
ncbi:hypothetical protein [Lactobacillus plantarum] [Leuconostoc pseudomesenteroides]|nr:hypothetical protein [Lactobacillus plantarum] [Leuconostoc pseudomesenteroides]